MGGAQRLPSLQFFAPSFFGAGAVRNPSFYTDLFGISAGLTRIVPDLLDRDETFVVGIHEWKPAIA
jgi:hypothetical protein